MSSGERHKQFYSIAHKILEEHLQEKIIDLLSLAMVLSVDEITGTRVYREINKELLKCVRKLSDEYGYTSREIHFRLKRLKYIKFDENGVPMLSPEHLANMVNTLTQ